MTRPRAPTPAGVAAAASTNAEPAGLRHEADLYAVLAALDVAPTAPGAAIAVAARGQTVTAAVGAAAPDGRAMTAGTPVRLASLTKAFTAAILRLWATGLLNLDAPVADQIAPEHAAMLRSGGYDTGTITVRHLLMHAGGLADHDESPAYLGAVLDDPAHVWAPTGQISVMLNLGPPLSAPGAAFAYSDTEYVQLGEIIEGAILFTPLGEAGRVGGVLGLKLAPAGEPRRVEAIVFHGGQAGAVRLGLQRGPPWSDSVLVGGATLLLKRHSRKRSLPH